MINTPKSCNCLDCQHIDTLIKQQLINYRDIAPLQQKYHRARMERKYRKPVVLKKRTTEIDTEDDGSEKEYRKQNGFI